MRIPSGVTDQYIYFVAVDATDLKTRETGLSSFTVYRSRNGAAAAAFTTPTINETDSTNMPGVYELLLDEDTTIDSGDQSQEVCLHITHAGMAPVTRVFELYRPSVTAGETIDVSSGGVEVGSFQAGAINAAAVADGTIDRATFAADTGLQPARSSTAQAGAAGTITLDASASATTDFYDGMVIYLTGGTGAGQHRLCTAYNGTTKVATVVPNWATNPDNTSTFAVLPVGASSVIAINNVAVSTTTAQLGVNVVQISADATAADNLETAFDDTAGPVRWTGIIDQGTAQAVAAGTITLRAAAAFANNELAGNMVRVVSATTGAGQTRRIASNVGATDVVTLDANWTTTPTGTVVYQIMPETGESAAAIRAAVGLASANLDTQLDALPTNAELATALGTADDAVLAAVAALNNISAAQVNAEVDTAIADAGLATAANLAVVAGYLDTEIAAILADTNELQTDWANGGRLDLILDARASQTSVDDIPTNAELATALGTADDAVLAQIALVKAQTDLIPSDPADASVIAGRFDTLDTSIADLPTNAELAVATANLDATVSSRASAANLATVAGYLDTEIAAILQDTSTDIPAQIAALNNLSAAQVNAEVDTALADYDGPTNAEMVARTLAAADYATATAVSDLPTNAELATALAGFATQASLDAVAAQVEEVWQIHGLDIANPMTVTPTSRDAGTIAQTISGDGTTTSTVTRTA